MNTNENTGNYLAAMKLSCPSMRDQRALIGSRTYIPSPPTYVSAGALDWQLYGWPNNYGAQNYVNGYDGGSTMRTNDQNSVFSPRDSGIGTVSEAKAEHDDGIGCMLHDLGADCGHCVPAREDQRPEKFGGKSGKNKNEKHLYISSDIGSVFDDITFYPSTTNMWIAGLGQREPRPASKGSREAVDSFAVPDACGTCGTDATYLKADGAGHCVECRYRWLDLFRAEQAKAAQMSVLKTKKSGTVNVLAKTKSRYDWDWVWMRF